MSRFGGRTDGQQGEGLEALIRFALADPGQFVPREFEDHGWTKTTEPLHVWQTRALLAAFSSFDGLTRIAQRILDTHYPGGVFDGSSGDPGARLVVALRDVLEAARV